MSERTEEKVLIRAAYPFVAVPKNLDVDRLLFVERMEGIAATARCMYAIATVLVAGAAAVLVAVLLGLGSGISIAHLVVIIGINPLLGVWIVRKTHERMRRRRDLVVDVRRRRSGIRWSGAHNREQTVETADLEGCLELRPCDFDGTRLGHCLLWRIVDPRGGEVFPLGLARDVELLIKYSEFVFGPAGITAARADEPIQLERPAPPRKLGGSEAVLDGVMNCRRCRYDLTGVVSRLCPECGAARAFVPPCMQGAIRS